MQTANECRGCHADYDQTDDYEPYDSWRGAMMSHAGRDPVFRAALAIAEQDNPDAADFCVRCHSPFAWLRGRSSLAPWSAADGARLAPDGDGFVSSDLDGITCMVCHRSTDTVASDPAAPYLQNAQLFYLDGVDGETRLGPYTYDPMTFEPPHPYAQSTFLASGDFCGQCHDIVNPVVSGKRLDGSDTGRPFAIERTYSEWKNSVFSSGATMKTCQGCHMVDVTQDVAACSTGPDRSYMRRHDLVGGNTWVPKAMAAALPPNNDDVVAALQKTAEQAVTMLQSAATLEIVTSALENDRVTARIQVTNQTGHKLPTGYPEGRQMWLEVAVLDENNTLVAGSGVFNEQEGRILVDTQFRSYEIKLGEGSTPSFHFIRNNTVLEDTRIPPEGFTAPEALDMAPIGREYKNQDGSFRHWDTADFGFDACGGPLTLRVRLLYQTTSAKYIEFLRDNAPDSIDPDVSNWGAIAYQAWQDHGGKQAVIMAEQSAALGMAASRCPEPGSDAGMADGGTAVDAGSSDPPRKRKGCMITADDEAEPFVNMLLWFAMVALARIRRRPSSE